MSPNTAFITSRPFGVAVLVFIAVAVALHMAVVFVTRSWAAFVASAASIVTLAALLLVALMKVTGDSL